MPTALATRHALALAVTTFLIGLQQQALAQAVAAPDGAASAPIATLPPVTVNASADASAAGLTRNYPGGQVARGGRAGLLGNIDAMDAPFSSLNFTNELIQNQQARTVGDVLLNDPGVRNARGFGNFQEVYFIRGFLVYSDDMAYNGLYGLLPRQTVSTELLERVEVIRGANSFLNGAAPNDSGIGGAINLLPKRAPAQPLTQVTVGVESGGQAYTALDVARRFGPDKRFGVRFNAAGRNGDTAVDDEGVKLGVFALGLDYRGHDFRVSADIGHQDHKLEQPRPNVSPAFGATAIPDAPDATRNYAQSWTFSNERQTFGTLRGEWDLAPNVTAWAAAGARRGHERNRLAGPTAAADGTFSTYRFDNDRVDTVKTGELGLRATLAAGSVEHQLSASASAFLLDSRNAYGFSAFNALAGGTLDDAVNVAMPGDAGLTFGGDLDDPHITRRVHTWGVALADSMVMLEGRLRLTLGVRHQSIRESTYDYVTRDENPTSPYDAHRVTPLAGVVYKLSPQISAFANYSEALNKGLSIKASATAEPKSTKPFLSKQVEVGMKYDGGRLGSTVSLFQVKKPTYSGTAEDIGEVRHRGLELSVYGEAARGVRVLGGATFLDAELLPKNDPATDGNQPIGVPKVLANLGVEWDVPALQGLTLSARTLYTGKQYADAANQLRIPSWTRLDLGASYSTTISEQLVTFRARVDNVTNRSYWASGGGYPDIGYLVLGNPRTFALSAAVEF